MRLLSIYKKLGIGKASDTMITLEVVNQSIKHLYKGVKDVLMKVNKLIFLTNFVLLELQEDNDIPLIFRKLVL